MSQLRPVSAVPEGVPDLEPFVADVAARLSARAWPLGAGERAAIRYTWRALRGGWT